MNLLKITLFELDGRDRIKVKLKKERSSMQYKCSACDQKIEGDMLVYLDHTEKHIVDLLKYDHPEWVEKDGVCQKCVDYYKAELEGTTFKDAPCAIRRRKGKKILNFFKGMFTGGQK